MQAYTHRGGLSWFVELVSDDMDLLHSASSEIMGKYYIDDLEQFPKRYADPWPPLKPPTVEK